MATLARKAVFIPGYKKPPAPYSPAVVIDKTVYVSGQLGINADGELVSGGVAAEVEQIMKNMKALLQAAGTNMNNVVKVSIFLKNINDLHKINNSNVYSKHFTQCKPARTAYQIESLALGAHVEIEAIAVIGDIADEESGN